MRLQRGAGSGSSVTYHKRSVEPFMKQLVRSKISNAASGIEMLISILVLVGTAVSCIALFLNIYELFSAFVTSTTSQSAFDVFLAFGIQLIIAVEFVKMLAKHTPGSTVEVLLVVIAKRVVVDKLAMWDILAGVIAIAVLFLIKKYLFTSEVGYTISGEVLYDAATSVKEFNKIFGCELPLHLGETLGSMIEGQFANTGRQLRLHERIKIADVAFYINEIQNGHVKKLEIVREEHNDEPPKHFSFPFFK